MEPVKVFNNGIIGQFVLTGVPVKVYVGGRYLHITDTDDIESPDMGFGMDENGAMRHFNYLEVDHLLVAGNQVTIDTYNDGMGATEDEEPKEPEAEEEDEKVEDHYMPSLASLMNEEFVTLGDLKLNAFQKRKFDKHLKKHKIKIDKEETNTGGYKEITYSAPTERDLVHLFKAAGGYYPDGGVQWINKEND